MHYAITWIKDESNLIDIINALLKLKPGFLNSQSVTLVQNAVSYKLNESDVRYSMVKRSRWTPLMYAVLMRKNRVAKHLISKGADKNIKGMDDVSVDEIIQKRCIAYTCASQFGTIGNADRVSNYDGIVVNVTVDPSKKVYVEDARKRIIEDIINELSEKYAY